MIATLSTTIRLLKLADSLMPITSTIVISTDTRIAGRLMNEPVAFHPTWAHPATAACTLGAVHSWYGACASAAGMWMPKMSSRLARWPDQPTATVAAPIAYSSTRSHPMIHATSSPIVAYE